MANICSTSYVFVGSDDKVKELRSCLKKLKDTERTVPPIDPTWIGYIVQDILGKKWEDVYCRGEWDFSWNDDEDSNTHLRIYTDTAWNACNECFYELAEKYDLAMFYVSEELGFGIYDTNDSQHTYFPDYIIVTSEDETEYIEGREKVMEYINQHIGTDFKDWDTMLSDETVGDVFDIYELEVV